MFELCIDRKYLSLKTLIVQKPANSLDSLQYQYLLIHYRKNILIKFNHWELKYSRIFSVLSFSISLLLKLNIEGTTICSNSSRVLAALTEDIRFLWEEFSEENEPQKRQSLQKILKISHTSNAWTAIFKNADFS